MKKLITFLSAVATVAILIGCSGGKGFIDEIPESGTLDENFGGGNGYRVYDSGNEDKANDVIVDSSNNIYVIGKIDNSLGVLKYKPNGSLNSNFDGDGILNMQINNQTTYGLAGAIKDNRLIIAGSTNMKGVLICRDKNSASKCSGFSGLNSYVDNTALNSYNDLKIENNYIYTVGAKWTNGKVYLHKYVFNNGNYNHGQLVDNSAYVSGMFIKNSYIFSVGMKNNDAIIWRNNKASLSNNGYKIKMNIAGGNGIDNAKNLVIDNDGNIYITGISKASDNKFKLFVIKLKPNGTYDTTFANNGKYIYTFQSMGQDITFDKNGKLVVVGNTKENGDDDVLVLRMDKNGNLDTSFGDNGKVVEDLENGDQIAKAVAIDNNNKIIVAGSDGVGNNADMFVMKINP